MLCLETTPPLKWAGGKRWLTRHLLSFWKPHKNRRLVEPFCGGLAVSLGLQPDRALLNDVNPHLVNFYQQLQKGLLFCDDLENNSFSYYEARKEFNSRARAGYQEKRDAVLFYYLNRTGFNGLCRLNAKGEFNVPFGKFKKINYIQDFTHYKASLERWTFTCGDFEKITIQPDDFIYADPPYDTPFTQYSAGGFSWDDQVRLVKWLVKHPVPVIASNQATDRILDLYRSHGFEVATLPAPRRISCNGDRSPALEMFALKGFGNELDTKRISA